MNAPPESNRRESRKSRKDRPIPSEPIAMIPKNRQGEIIRVAFREFNGVKFLDVRVVLQPDGPSGDIVFTPKGVAVPLRRIPGLIDALTSALQQARARGMFDE